MGSGGHYTCFVCKCVSAVTWPIYTVPANLYALVNSVREEKAALQREKEGSSFSALYSSLSQAGFSYTRLDMVEYFNYVFAPSPEICQFATRNPRLVDIRQVRQLVSELPADSPLLPGAKTAVVELVYLDSQITNYYSSMEAAHGDRRASGLQWETVAAMIETAARTDDYGPLTAEVVRVFSSLRLLNRSFLSRKHHTSMKSPGLEMKQIRLFYSALQALPSSVLEQATTALIRMLETIDHVNYGPFSEPEQLRFFLIVLENPAILEPRYHATLLSRLCCELIAVEMHLSQYLLRWFCRAFIPSSFQRIVSAIQQYLTLRLYVDVDVYHDWAIISSIKVLGYFNMANNLAQIIPFNSFYNLAINESLNVDLDFKYWIGRSSGFCFCQYPYVLNISNKNSILKQEAFAQMSQEVRDAVKNAVLRGVRSSPYLKLSVRREHLIVDTLQQLQSRSHELKKQLRVHFIGEDAVDAGGVTKEFFQLIIRDIFDPKYGMFIHNDETNCFWFNGVASTMQDTTQEFRMIGTIVGLAIYNGVILDLRFPFVVYRKLLGFAPTFEDIKQVDPTLARGFQQLLDLPEGSNVEDLYDTFFEAPRSEFGTVVMHELKVGGREIRLTYENRQEYVDLYIDWLLSRSIGTEFNAFREGFLAVCGGNALSLLKPDELELLICGNPSLDTYKLQKVAKYRTGYSEDSQTIINFWSLFHSWPLEKQKKLLAFITGSDRIPFEGVSELVLVIDRPLDFHGGVHQLPVAHACFNQLVLPDYGSLTILEEKLSIAIENSEGFGLR